MKHAQNIFESLLVFHNIFSLDDRMNLHSILLSERFRRAEESVMHQMRDFSTCRTNLDGTGHKKLYASAKTIPDS